MPLPDILTDEEMHVLTPGESDGGIQITPEDIQSYHEALNTASNVARHIPFVGGLTSSILSPDVRGRTMGQGTTLNLGDELRSVLGGFGETGDKYAAIDRMELGQYAQENPWSAFGLEMLGSLPYAAIGGAGVAKAPNLIKKGMELAKVGAGYGGAYGFGSGEGMPWERIPETAAGAATGAVLAPAIGAGFHGLGVLGGMASNKVTGGLARAGMERGSISTKPANIPISPAEARAVHRLRNVGDDLAETVGQWEKNVQSGTPQALVEAFPEANIQRLAHRVASSPEGGDIAEKLLQKRAEGTYDRLLNLVGAPDDISAGLAAGREAAQETVDEIISKRSTAAKPAYRKVRTAHRYLKSNDIKRAMKDPLIDDYITEAMNDKYLKLGKARRNEFRTLDATKQKMDADLFPKHSSKLRGKQWTNVNNARARLVKAMDAETGGEKGLYATARGGFSSASEELEKVTNSPLGWLVDLTDPQKAEKALGRFIKLRDTDQAKALSLLTPERRQKIADATHAYLADVIETTNESSRKALFNKIAGTPRKKASLDKLLDVEGGADDMLRLLKVEEDIAASRSKYGASRNSRTEILAEERAMEGPELATLGAALVTGKWGQAGTQLARAGARLLPKEKHADELAQILFDPKTGLETVKKSMPILKEQAAAREAMSQIGRTTGGVGAREGAVATARQEQPLTSRTAKQRIERPPQQTAMKMQPRQAEAVGPAKGYDWGKLMKAQQKIESNMNPKAVSEAGAIGLGQITKKTGRDIWNRYNLAKKYKTFDLTNPKLNAEIQDLYMKELLKTFDGNVELALTAYHSGPGTVRKLVRLANEKGLPVDLDTFLTLKTKNWGPRGKAYARKVLNAYKGGKGNV